MNQAKFDCIANLIRCQGGPSEQGARLVLLHGIDAIDAASTFEISPQAITKLCRRFRRIERQIEAAWGVMGEQTAQQFYGRISQ